MSADAGQDREPDYRMSLAAERTYLAYVRTALALTAAGVGVAVALPSAGALPARRGLGIGLIVFGAVVIVFARSRLAAVTRAMRSGQPMPSFRVGAAAFTAALLAVAATAVVVVLLA